MSKINVRHFFDLFIYFLVISSPCFAFYRCHHCNSLVFGESINADNLPYPTDENCVVVRKLDACFIEINWFSDGTTGIHYELKSQIYDENVFVKVDRRFDLKTNRFLTEKTISYTCQSNKLACNTVDDLESVLRSVSLPQDFQISMFDQFLSKTAKFNKNHCRNESNSANCPLTQLDECQQCFAFAENHKINGTCASCVSDRVTSNFFVRSTRFFIQNRTRFDSTEISCQLCHPKITIDQIQQQIQIGFDFQRYFSSANSKSLSELCLFVSVLRFLSH